MGLVHDLICGLRKYQTLRNDQLDIPFEYGLESKKDKNKKKLGFLKGFYRYIAESGNELSLQYQWFLTVYFEIKSKVTK